MKNFTKLAGIIACVTIIGFSFASCDNGTTSGGDDRIELDATKLIGTWINDTDEELSILVKTDENNEYLFSFMCDPSTGNSSGSLGALLKQDGNAFTADYAAKGEIGVAFEFEGEKLKVSTVYNAHVFDGVYLSDFDGLYTKQ